jgi:integrase
MTGSAKRRVRVARSPRRSGRWSSCEPPRLFSASAGVPLRTLQEWLGHRDFTTTLIYADYAPNPHEAELVEQAFRLPDSQPATGKVLP